MRHGTRSAVWVVALVGWAFLEPADAQRRREPVQLPEGTGQALKRFS